MRIFLRGSEDRVKVMQAKIGSGHELISFRQSEGENAGYFSSFDVIIDLNLDDESSRLPEYNLFDGRIVIGSAVKKSLAQMCDENNLQTSFHFIGINGLPAFLDKERLEISFLNKDSKNAFEKTAIAMNWKYKIVHDRVGMVTPRVICMIINEAFYTLQEGIASRDDIEAGMKLGTAFPYGPFEWCDKIGIKNVYETLVALYSSTKDERYIICELLKDHYLLAETVHA